MLAEFKDIILKLRNERGFNQAQMGEAVGTSKSTVGMWEMGERFPSKEILENIADYFNVDMDYLYGRTEIRKKIHFDELGNEYVSKSLVQDNGQSKYYIDDDTAKMAQQLKDNKDVRLLFDASRDATAEDLKQTADYLLYLKRKERGEL